jgi:hypothetical protein
MNDEFGWIRSDHGHTAVLSTHLPGGTEENFKDKARVPTEIPSKNLLKTSPEHSLPLYQPV